MYDQFTEPCRQLIQRANQEAIGMKSRYISSGHLLLALVAAADPIAELVRSFGVREERTRKEVRRLLEEQRGIEPEIPQMKNVVEHMMDVARRFNHEHVGTEHLLVGLLYDRNDLAARALDAIGVDISGLRNQVLARMTPASAEEIRRKIVVESQLSNHPEVLCLKQRIEQLQRNLEEAVSASDFQKGASYRDERIAAVRELKQVYTDLRRDR
jgi:ATP-dependent Clp protease ATP-binding subunit ClpA